MPETVGLAALMPAETAAEPDDALESLAEDETEEVSSEEAEATESQAPDEEPDDDEDEEASSDSGSEAAADQAAARLATALGEVAAGEVTACGRIADLARSAERARIAAIVGAPEAKGRDAAAQKLALSGLDVAAARGVLGTLPKGSRLDERMAAEPQPAVGPGGQGGGDEIADAAERLLSYVQ